MLLKVGTQVSNALKITLTKFYQHLSCGSQVFKGRHNKQRQTTNDKRLTTPKEFSRLCYRPHREITRCGQKKTLYIINKSKSSDYLAILSNKRFELESI